MNEVQGQREFDEEQRLLNELKGVEREIESGHAWWYTFERHAALKDEYNKALARYLAAA